MDHWTDRLRSCGHHLSNYLFQYFTVILTAPDSRIEKHSAAHFHLQTRTIAQIPHNLYWDQFVLFPKGDKTWFLFSPHPLSTNQLLASFSNCHTFILKQFPGN